MNTNDKVAIVLSGGGSKGSYQIGVWKALRKLNIEYDIITGTSVGALNGMMMVQNDYKKASRLWKRINYKAIFGSEFNSNKVYFNYAKEFIKNGGMDISRLENIISIAYNKNKFFNSKTDYGIVTYNITKFKEELILKSNLNDSNIKDYVIASASCFPAFKMKKIKDSKYIDGGYYDNLPINLAIDLGAKKIIAVDLRTPGIKQKTNFKEIDIKYIYPKNDIGSFLKFEKQITEANFKYGYNDTLKAYQKLCGNKYSFYKNSYNSFIESNNQKFIQHINKYLNEDNSVIKDVKCKISKKLFKLNDNSIQEAIEYLGKTFNLADYKIYNINIYNFIIKQKFKKIPLLNRNEFNDAIKKRDVKGLLNNKYIVKYIYEVLKENIKENDICALSTIFKHEFLAATYIITIGG